MGFGGGRQAAPVAAPPPVDYVEIQRQNDAQTAASNRQLVLLQQQGQQQEAQFQQLLKIEQDRAAALETQKIEQQTLFSSLQAEQEAAQAIAEARRGRAENMAQTERAGLFQLSNRTVRTNAARREFRATTPGASANVFRR